MESNKYPNMGNVEVNMKEAHNIIDEQRLTHSENIELKLDGKTYLKSDIINIIRRYENGQTKTN